MKTITGAKIFFYVYFSSVLLLAVLPINAAGDLNNITILRFRGDYFLHGLIFVPWMIFLITFDIDRLSWMFYGILYATVNEGVQFLLPYRTFNVNDLAANIIGIIIGIVILLGLQRFKGKNI